MGSEMCIRDSPQADRPPAGRAQHLLLSAAEDRGLTARASEQNKPPAFQPGARLYCSGKIVQRVAGHAVVTDLEVAVIAGGVAGGAHPCDLLALVDVVAHGDRQAAVVP